MRLCSAFFRPGVSPDAEEEAGALERVVICGEVAITLVGRAMKMQGGDTKTPEYDKMIL
ncbi:MAG: hypothetical protein ABSA82_09930 [Thermacetogeniaceae bacterium]|jgi:hypothetical protein